MPEGRGGFNEAKYKAMLEGLEISEINKSDLERTLRIDSEFYSKENLEIIEILQKLPLNSITELVKVSDGNHMAISDKFSEVGVPYYRGQDIHQYFIEDSTPICIDDKSFDEPVMKRSHLKEGDVLLSIVGTIGGVSLVSSNEKATCSCKLAIFRPQSTDGYFLSAFLKSKYGQNQIKKFTRGAIQMGLILEDMSQIMIPKFSDTFQKKIRDCIDTAKGKSNSSIKSYNSAEILLLQTIGLEGFEPSTQGVNVKTFKESYLTSGRLDSEYYQKKYEDYEAMIKTNSLGFTLISNEYTIVKGVSKKEKESYNYIEIGDVNVSDGSASCSLIETSELPANAKIEAQFGDLIISKVRSNRGAVSVIDFATKNLIVSGAFTVLREKKTSVFSNETLKVLLRTKVYKDWLLQFNIGTQYPVIRDEDVLNMPIPKIPRELQDKITKEIQSSQALKKQSEQLLETAKRAVEIAIEQDEEAAMRYIEQAQRASM